MELNLSELREILAVLNQTDITELTIKSSEFELVVRKGSQNAAPTGAESSSVSAVAPLLTGSTPLSTTDLPPIATVSATATAATPAPAATSPMANRLVDITSPMVGTFYRSPAPDEGPFVEVGDRVRSGQTVCIIEAMKLMNELEAEVSGEIVEILAQNAEPVEFGQVLMRVNPA